MCTTLGSSGAASLTGNAARSTPKQGEPRAARVFLTTTCGRSLVTGISITTRFPRMVLSLRQQLFGPFPVLGPVRGSWVTTPHMERFTFLSPIMKIEPSFHHLTSCLDRSLSSPSWGRRGTANRPSDREWSREHTGPSVPWPLIYLTGSVSEVTENGSQSFSLPKCRRRLESNTNNMKAARSAPMGRMRTRSPPGPVCLRGPLPDASAGSSWSRHQRVLEIVAEGPAKHGAPCSARPAQGP